MKKFFIAFLIFTIGTSSAIQAQSENAKPKMLVTYFSVPETDAMDASTGASRMLKEGRMIGTTAYVAELIGKITGANLFEIKTLNSYPTQSHKALVDYAKKEAESKTYPKIVNPISDFNDYEIVFVGYPNWWYDMPLVIYTLFNEYDFSGKTVIPFCTHGGSGFSQSIETIKRMEKNAKVISMPALSRNRVANAEESIKKWLQSNGIIE